MRQLNIKQLKNNLCKELQDLPFQITKYGKVVATIMKESPILDEKVATTSLKRTDSTESVHNPISDAKGQLADIVEKKKKSVPLETTSPTGGGFFNPQPKGKK